MSRAKRLSGLRDVAEVVLVLVEREHDPAAALEDRVEERVAVGVAGAADGVGVGHRRSAARGPTAPPRPRARRAASGRASRTGRRAATLASRGSLAHRRAERLRVGVEPLARRRAQRLELSGSTTPSARTSRAWISGSGNVPGQRLEQRVAQVERVARELEVEERRLGLLELARGRQDVVGEARGLGHRDVDHDDEVERLERLAHAPESASECAGLMLSTIIARKRSGWSVRISSGMTLHGMRPPITGAPVTGVRPTRGPAEQRAEPRVQVLAAGLGEVAGEDPEQLVEVGAQRAVRAPAGRRGPRTPRRSARCRCGARRRADELLVDAAARGRSRRSGRRRALERIAPAPVDVRGDEVLVDEPSWTSMAASAARHQASAPGRTRRWKSASFAVSVTTGSMTIIERCGSLAISFSTMRARGKLCDIHGFLPMNTDDLGVLELAARVAAEELRVDPGLAGLLLGERVRAVARRRAPCRNAPAYAPPRWFPWPPPP